MSISYVKVVAYPSHNEITKVVQVRLMVAWRPCGPTIYTGLSLLNNHFHPAIITLARTTSQYFSLLLPFDSEKSNSSCVWSRTNWAFSERSELWAMNKVLLATNFLVFLTLFGFIVSDRPQLEDEIVRTTK